VNKICRVAVAEDSADDFFLLERCVRLAPALRIVHHSTNGADMIDYLAGQRDYAQRERFPLPDLVLLDLKMPICDGFEVLKWLQQHPMVKRPWIAVLSSSNEKRDVDQAKTLGADEYLIKPATLEALTQIVQKLEAECVERANYNLEAQTR